MIQDYKLSSRRLSFIRPRFSLHRSPFSPRSEPSLHIVSLVRPVARPNGGRSSANTAAVTHNASAAKEGGQPAVRLSASRTRGGVFMFCVVSLADSCFNRQEVPYCHTQGKF
ncbi:hypothetical protein TNCV_3808171 [Trichonephila clavipes]|nr:hypothetical protein TNCV_3808171 [Trichonephila clavipes]